MSADRCDLTDLMVSECAHCRGDSLDTDYGPVERWIGAQFDSRLACGHLVSEGDRIARTEDGWICEGCAS